MTLGDVIKQYRQEHGMSMEGFARKSKISKAYIGLLEKNKHPKTGKPITPSVPCIKMVADAIGMDFSALFNLIEQDVQISDYVYPDYKAGTLLIETHPVSHEKGSESSLTSEEVRLLAYFAKLSQNGKEKALERMQELEKLEGTE